MAYISDPQLYGEDTFMPAKTITMSEQGRCSYQGTLNNWIYPALGEIKMPEVSPGQISKMLVAAQGQGKAHATVV